MENLIIGFDFDQTLADSSPGIVDCLQIVNLAFAKEVPLSELHRLSLSGRPLRETLSEIVSSSEIEPAKELFLEKYPTIGIQGTKLFPGVHELFGVLKREQFKIVILSAKTHKNLILSLDHLKVDVNQAIGGLDFAGKVKAIQDLKLDFYVGDQFSDMKAAAEAHCKGILVCNPSSEELPVPVHARFKDIDGLLGEFKSVFSI